MGIYLEYEPTEDGQFYLALHGSIMIIVFCFFVPCALFPVRHHQLALNTVRHKWRVREWLYLHVVYSLPIYPLILVAMICAKVAPRGHLPYLSKTNSTLFTEVHSNVGVICHQIYAVEFFVGLFSYSFLRNTSDRALRRFHSAMNYIGILFSGSGHKIHILWSIRLSGTPWGSNIEYIIAYTFFIVFQVCLHFIMKYLDTFGFQVYFTKPEAWYLEEIELTTQLGKWARPRRSDEHLIGSTAGEPLMAIQQQDLAKLYKFAWRTNMVVCLGVSAVMIYSVVSPDCFYPSATRSHLNFKLMGDSVMDWGNLNAWV